MPEKHAIRVVRADAGFFDQQLLSFLEQRELCYIVVARLPTGTLLANFPGRDVPMGISEMTCLAIADV